jgi:DNA gyrase subunit A
MCADDQDILLTTRKGRAIRFGVAELRLFAGRTSTGVRGIRLQPDDEVVAMSILGGGAFSVDEREAYIRTSRRGEDDPTEEEGEEGLKLSDERLAAMASAEQFILTVSEKGFGKRTSSYAYRRTGRGGQGVATLDVAKKTGLVVDALPVEDDDQVMLLTDRGQLVRFSVDQIRVSGRKTQGVTLFRLDGDEKVTSVVRLSERDDEDEGEDDTPAETA